MKILEQQDSGTCTKTLKVEMPRTEVDAHLDEVYSEFAQKAQIPGFRKGKVSRKVLEMKYGRHLRDEAEAKAIEKAFKEAVKELGLDPATQPTVTDVEKKDKEQPIVFEAKFEYRPQVQLADYRELKIEIPSKEISEKEVVETLNRLRENNAMFATVDDRAAASGDFVTISCKANIGNDPFLEATHDDLKIELGSGNYIPGFEEQIEGTKVGEEKTFNLTLPPDYPDEDRRGKEATFMIKIKQIQEKRQPELDDEFAKDLGDYENLDQLKERIRKDLEHNQEHRLEHAIESGIRQELLRINTFDVPPSMVEARYNYINALQDMEYRRFGQSLQAAIQQDEGLLARNRTAAEDEVRFSLILNAIAKEEGIEASDNDYVTYVERMARHDKAEPQLYLSKIESQGLKSHYQQLALEEKVIKYLKTLVETVEQVGD